MRRCFVYILASRSRTLYVGVTNDIRRRVYEHRALKRGFTGEYRIGRLVYFEIADNPRAAISREKAIKGWTRARKVALIERANPGWDDLAAGWYDH
jgi:putative endonuclease